MHGKYMFKTVSSLIAINSYVPSHRVDIESDKTFVMFRTM